MGQGSPPRRRAAPPQPLRSPLEAQERILLAAAVADLREELYRQRLILQSVVEVLIRHGVWPSGADPHPRAEPRAPAEPAPAASGRGARGAPAPGGGRPGATAAQGGAARRQAPARGRPSSSS